MTTQTIPELHPQLVRPFGAERAYVLLPAEEYEALLRRLDLAGMHDLETEVKAWNNASDADLAAEEAKWDASFAATDQAKLQAFIDASLAEGDEIGISDEGDELTPVPAQVSA